MRRGQGYDPGPNGQTEGKRGRGGQTRVSDELNLLQHLICHFFNDHYSFLTPACWEQDFVAARAALLTTLHAEMDKYYVMKQPFLCIHFV